jgi:hypothetical protein
MTNSHDRKDPTQPTTEQTHAEENAASAPQTISRRGLVAGVVALPVLMQARSAGAQAKANAPAVKIDPASLTGAKAVQTRTTLFSALDKISRTEDLVKAFSAKPVDALSTVGWSTDKNFPKVDARTIQSFANRVQAHNPAALTVCGSVGCVVCASVGGDT